MNDAQKKKLIQAITEQIAQIKADIPRMKEQLKPVSPDAAIGRLSRLDTMINQGVTEAALANAKERLAGLQTALDRINDGDPDYGLCEECDEPIAVPRLMAMPEARLCVECAEELD